MARWICKVNQVVRNVSYSDGEEDPPRVIEVKYTSVDPFWALIEPEDPPNSGVFIYTYTGDRSESGATWYPSEDEAKRAAAFEFGFGNVDPWIFVPVDVEDPFDLARHHGRLHDE